MQELGTDHNTTTLVPEALRNAKKEREREMGGEEKEKPFSSPPFSLSLSLFPHFLGPLEPGYNTTAVLAEVCQVA